MTDGIANPRPATLLEPARSYRSRQSARRAVDPDITHGGATVGRYVTMQVLGTLFPFTAGVLLYGWRAIGSVAVVVVAALTTALVWRGIGRRGKRVRYDMTVLMSVLLGMTLPAHLFNSAKVAGWPVLAAAGAGIVILTWLLGGAASGRLHPVLIVHLLLFVLFTDLLPPQFTLRREHALTGDLLDAPVATAPTRTLSPTPQPSPRFAPTGEQFRQAWILAEPENSPYDAVRTSPAAQRLETFTGGHEHPERSWLSLESLVRDRLPPLEDLIVGGQPAPIGQGSAIAVIIGGLFLLYRGLIDYRVPLVIVLTAFCCFLVLPVPVVITESQMIWRWLVMWEPGVGAPLGVTFANYEIMASPLLFTAFFLATSPAVRPLARRARVIYAFAVGITTALFQLYVSVTIGPYLALLGISLLTPTLDRLFGPRTLV
jgi:Na+-translocating ferredoxin:NAD+ oxidoreductase RnfD subunit